LAGGPPVWKETALPLLAALVPSKRGAVRLVLVLGLAAIIASPTALPAVAQDVPRLAEEVTDEVGALDGEGTRVRAALQEVRERDGVHLFAYFTDTTGELTVTNFADAVAAESSLGGNNALLVVALTDRSYALWVSDALTGVSDADIQRILLNEVEPRLADGEFADAAIVAAEALGAAAATPPGEPLTAVGDGAGPWEALILILAGAAVLGVVVAGRVRAPQVRRHEAA
jgi:uncharacterized membrane protein YgcG